MNKKESRQWRKDENENKEGRKEIQKYKRKRKEIRETGDPYRKQNIKKENTVTVKKKEERKRGKG